MALKSKKRGPGRPPKSRAGKSTSKCRLTKTKKSCATKSRCSWRKGTGCIKRPKRKSIKSSKKSAKKSNRKYKLNCPEGQHVKTKKISKTGTTRRCVPN